MIEKGQRILVRAGSSGVHFGTLESHNGQEVHLINARRLWSWTGALSLNEVATSGVNVKESKISVAVEEIILPTAIEIIKLSSTCNLPK